MNVEIRKVANGYMVLPVHDYHQNQCCKNEEVYVFSTYDELAQGLLAILEPKEQK